jgi:hypothetical protein
MIVPVPKKKTSNSQKITGFLPPSSFNPKLSFGELKPLLPKWIDDSDARLKTPEMKACIATCFKNDGCFGFMRDPDQISSVRASIDSAANPVVVVPVPAGEMVDADTVED